MGAQQSLPSAPDDVLYGKKPGFTRLDRAVYGIKYVQCDIDYTSSDDSQHVLANVEIPANSYVVRDNDGNLRTNRCRVIDIADYDKFTGCYEKTNMLNNRYFRPGSTNVISNLDRDCSNTSSNAGIAFELDDMVKTAK